MTSTQEPVMASNKDDVASGSTAAAVSSTPAANDRPGRMAPATGHMELVTRMGHEMWQGRRASRQGQRTIHGFWGAKQFAKSCSDIWRAASQDDPYADNALIEIELAWKDAMNAVSTQLVSMTEVVETGFPGIKLSPLNSSKPLKVELSFHNPWGYRAASLVKQFDDLVLAALTAKSVGLLFEDDWENSVSRTMSRLLHTFGLCRSWIHTGVTRNDVAANNEAAQRALKLYTEKHKNRMLAIDQTVLTGEQRAELSPRIQQRQG